MRTVTMPSGLTLHSVDARRGARLVISEPGWEKIAARVLDWLDRLPF